MEDIRAGAALSSGFWNILYGGLDGMREGLTFEELIAPVRERMMRIIWRIVRHPEEAEDTMQEVMTLVWKKLGRISRHPQPQALVLRICVNAAVDALRRQRRERRFIDSEILDRLPVSDSGGWEQKEIEIKVREAVARLPRNQAAAVMMRVLEGQSYEEIGRALGCREVTARTHVLRGRAKLSSWLDHLRPSWSKENTP